MNREFLIKIQGQQYEKGRGRLVFMFSCFVVALVILMVYSARFFWALLAPIFYILLSYRNLASEKGYIVDAFLIVNVRHDVLELEIKSTQKKVSGKYLIDYCHIDHVSMDNQGKVNIDFNVVDNRTARKQTLEFYTLSNDRTAWEEIIRTVSARRTNDE